MIEGLAALLAWLGTSTIVLADGRLGLALGMALTGLGLAVIAGQTGGALAAAAIGTGSGLAAGLRWQQGPPGWNLMPPGSTPRLVLCLASGLLALWLAATVMQGGGAAFRFAAMIAIALPAARVLVGEDVAASTTGAGALLLGVAVAAALHAPAPGPLAYAAAAVVAAGIAVWPRKPSRAA